jgi:hypothetical protein
VWHVSIHKTLLVTSWLAPFIIMAVGYLFFPPLRDQVTLLWHTNTNIWAGISVQLMCLIAWLIYEIWYTTHRNAAVYDLQLDAAVDISVLIVIMLMVGRNDQRRRTAVVHCRTDDWTNHRRVSKRRSWHQQRR